MAEILLTSEKFIKEVTNISDNLAGKFILPSLREAQEIKLKGILGSCLLRKLKDLIREDQIDADENMAYKDLVENCKYFLAYSTICEVLNKVSYKISNMGVTKTSDDNVQNATAEEIGSQLFYYQSKADSCCITLQTFILKNRTAFPELRDCDCSRIHSNLYSAATCGVFLGGPRGKRIRR